MGRGGCLPLGALRPAGRTVELRQERRPGDEDLLDTAAVLTLLRGGTVYVEEREKLPGAGVCAALFRW